MNTREERIIKVETVDAGENPELLTVLKGTANRIRLQIILQLSQGAKNVTQLEETLHIKQPSVSRHLRTLLEAGIISRKAEGNQNFYSLNAAPFARIKKFCSDTLAQL